MTQRSAEEIVDPLSTGVRRDLCCKARQQPTEVLGAVRLVRHHPTDLSRAFFSTMFTRRLDASGYARVKHWRVYAEEGLARCEVAV